MKSLVATADTPTQAPNRIRSAIPQTVKVLAIVAALAVVLKTLPVADALRATATWIESLGYWAPIAFIGIYAISVVCFLPGSILTAAGGALFGVVYGSVYVSIASTLGASLAFLIGRHLARAKIEKKIASSERFAAIYAAVADEGWKIVGLTRLSPAFPFTLLNYAYGLTRVKFRHYLVASWIGMMPGTVLYVYLGSLGKAAGEGKSPAQWAMYGVGLIATITVTVYVTKIARKALNQRLAA